MTIHDKPPRKEIQYGHQLVSTVLKENHDEFAGEGVTIGNYKFKLMVREELTAIRA